MPHSPQDNADFRDELVAYLDGELSPERHEAVQRRLREDPDLAREADRLDRTWRLLDHLPDGTPSEAFVDDTMREVRRTDRRRARRRRLSWVGAVASAAAVALVAVTFRSPEPVEPSRDLIDNLECVEVIYDHLRVAQADPGSVRPDRIAQELQFAEALDTLGVFADEAAN